MRKVSLYGGIALISAATLMFELTLTRLFAVAEWYHFAFLSVSVALLGYASSGTILALLPLHSRERFVPTLGVAFPIGITASYLVLNTVPFDSYQLAWDPRQIAYLLIYYLSLTIPFAFSGLIVAHYLALEPARSNRIYAANLGGSALGGLALFVALPSLGEGTVMATAGIGALGAALMLRSSHPASAVPRRVSSWIALVLTVLCAGLLWGRPQWMRLRLSPYKGLSYALQIPGAHLGYERWNVYSRVDVVESERIHSAPGLSLRYQGKLPPQYGLLVDGSDLSPITRRTSVQDTAFLDYLPSSLPYQLRSQPSALILQPRGGMDVAVALHLGARRVVVVEDNPLIIHVVSETYSAFVGGLYQDPRVRVVAEDPRSTLQRENECYDLIQISLADTYHPLSSGSYSLTENHLYTVEAIIHALRRLAPQGLLVMTRWFQEQPSETLRAAALIVTALEQQGIREPGRHLLAFRTWSTLTLLASPQPFSAADIATLRLYCDRLGYDLVYHPGLRREEANRYNLLPQPADYERFVELLSSTDRRAFYDTQRYDVSPSSDDRPFFSHFFRWRQVPEIIARLGATWQPFGGSGFLLILALLAIAIVVAGILVLLPLVWLRGGMRPPPYGGVFYRGRALTYFAALGLGYLFVEMPLMQQFILYLGQPARSFIVVLSALLLASGIGSILAPRVRLEWALPALVAAILLYPILLTNLFQATLHLALAARITVAILCLLPLGILLGIPFAGGLRRVEELVPGTIPWVWAINGSASVISSILAVVLALSWGYRLVLAIAAACYLIATLDLLFGLRPPGSPSAPP